MRKETYSKCDAATVHFNNEVAPVSKAREKKPRHFIIPSYATYLIRTFEGSFPPIPRSFLHFKRLWASSKLRLSVNKQC